MSSTARSLLIEALLALALVLIVALVCSVAPRPTRPPAPPARAQFDASRPKDMALTPADIWTQAEKEVYKSARQLADQHRSELAREIRYSKLIRGDTRRKELALTFDDGPHPGYTPKLLAILKREKVKATFFVVGELAAKHPDLVRAEAAAGNSVGDHTFHHVNLTHVPVSAVLAEWEANRDVIKTILGKPARFCRPPGGDYSAAVIAAAQKVGLTTVLWTDDPGDYRSPGKRVIETRVLDHVSNGGIILLHDGIQQTMDILPALIQYLKRKGYSFVTVDEMWSALPGRVEPRSASHPSRPVLASVLTPLEQPPARPPETAPPAAPAAASRPAHRAAGPP